MSSGTDDDRISARAYEIWEKEGRPHGRHSEHWQQAQQDLGRSNAESPGTKDPHPGMMGDGTEEQNLDQPGTPGARITEAEVREAFGTKKGKPA